MGQIYKIFVEGFFLCQCYVILKRVKALKLFEKAVKHMSEKESISNGKHRKNPEIRTNPHRIGVYMGLFSGFAYGLMFFNHFPTLFFETRSLTEPGGPV